jgi:polyphosphate glucokinase
MNTIQVSLGIDVGGSSLKAAPVNVSTGELLTPPQSVEMPRGGAPADIARAARQLADRFDVSGPVGCAFPSVVQRGVARTAAHIHRNWIGANGEELLEQALGRPVAFLNDADAAGMAEVGLGAARDCEGTVLVLTFGTGIGSALFAGGRLVPNTELGHLHLARGGEAEEYASGRIRTAEGLDWPAWAQRANTVLAEYHRLLWPDLFVLGGGLIEAWSQFEALLERPAQIRPARFGAQAGIVGAALAAAAGIHCCLVRP